MKQVFESKYADDKMTQDLERNLESFVYQKES